MDNVYVGLINSQGVEPSESTGYRRTRPAQTSDDAFWVIFPQATLGGYGHITHMALYQDLEDTAPCKVVPLQEPHTVHAGVTPLIKGTKLLLGIETSVETIVQVATDLQASTL